MAMLIFEGADGAGKTTLINALKEQVPNAIVASHGPYPDLSSNQLFEQYFDLMVAHQQKSLIFDRSWLSEGIYGSVIRKNCRLDDSQLRMLERACLGMPCTWVFCEAPSRIQFQNWQTSDQYVESPVLFNEIRDRYRQAKALFNHTAHKVISYNYAEDKQEEMLSMLVWALQLENPGPGAGNFQSRTILILGDQVNSKAGVPGWPFISKSRQGCSHWLAQQLEHDNIEESELYWVNVNDPKSKWPADHKPKWLEKLAPRKVIALGDRAKEILYHYDWDVPVYAIPHPQYHKRFNSKIKYLLGGLCHG